MIFQTVKFHVLFQHNRRQGQRKELIAFEETSLFGYLVDRSHIIYQDIYYEDGFKSQNGIDHRPNRDISRWMYLAGKVHSLPIPEIDRLRKKVFDVSGLKLY